MTQLNRNAFYYKMFIVTYYFFSIPAKPENPLARKLVSGNRNRTNKLFFLLFADDLAIISETPNGLKKP